MTQRTIFVGYDTTKNKIVTSPQLSDVQSLERSDCWKIHNKSDDTYSHNLYIFSKNGEYRFYVVNMIHKTPLSKPIEIYKSNGWECCATMSM